jgi:hypothetical protein
MKAWRNPINQERYRYNKLRTELDAAKVASKGDYDTIARLSDEAWEQYDKARVGKALRDNYTRILPAPSFLVTGLLHRAGVYGAPAAVMHDEEAPMSLSPSTLAALDAAPTNSVVGKLRKLLWL